MCRASPMNDKTNLRSKTQFLFITKSEASLTKDFAVNANDCNVENFTVRYVLSVCDMASFLRTTL